MRRLLSDEGGQALVEYGMIAGLLLLGLIVASTSLVKLQGAVFKGQVHALHSWRAP